MRTQTLSFKLFAGGILLLIVPMLFVGFFSYIKAGTALNRISEEQAVGIAKNVSGMVQAVLQEKLKAVSLLAVNNTLISLTKKISLTEKVSSPDKSIDSHIKQLELELARIKTYAGKNFENIFVTDINGIVIAESSPKEYKEEYKGKNFADQNFISEAMQGKTSLGTIQKSLKTGLPVIPVCAPIFSADNNLVGTLIVITGIESISQQTISIKVGKTGYAFVADQKGLIIIHPVNKYVLTLDITSLKGMENIVLKMLKKKTGVEPYFFQGIDKIAGYAPVQMTGWSVGVTQPVSEFRGAIRDIQIFMAGTCGILLPLTIYLIFIFSRKITRPIRRIVRGLNASSAQTAAAAREIASASQSLAESASQQAAALQEGSSTLVEIAAMTHKTSELTKGGEQLMDENIRKSGLSLRGLVELTQKMHKIEADSDKILDIIKSIDEIAFQTNLLALNAAVEAARAGEVGAGFAVVAEEVRNLAKRSKTSADNTRELLDITISRVSEAAESIKSINNDFGDIIESATTMGEKTAAITLAAKEQAAGIEAVSKAASEMETVTQMMASNSEQTAAASEELSAQSEDLKFYVDDLLTIIYGEYRGKYKENYMKKLRENG
ncbi:methyl-accepting chemotaxis protein [Desulfobacterales bacterium HSG17]|nr:methyl-accepting chemotaxis protein [Desulfobacterales bacterium HSG17]